MAARRNHNRAADSNDGDVNPVLHCGRTTLRIPSGEPDLSALRAVTHDWLVPRLVQEFLRERSIELKEPPMPANYENPIPKLLSRGDRGASRRERWYRGVVVWNRTKTVRNRETGKTEQRPRAESEWVRVEATELRIVSDQLWEAAREQNRRVREKHGPKRLGGMNRTVASRQYLFSSLLECGLCNANMVIVGGQPPNAQYGCPNHRYRGVCKNRVRIPQRKLEQQLLAALSTNLLDPRLEEERVQSFREQLKATLAAETRRTREAASQDSQLKEELAGLEKEQENLVDGNAKHGFSPALPARLAAVESRIAQIQKLRNAGVEPKMPEFTTDRDT